MKHLLLLAYTAFALLGADATGIWTGTLTPSDESSSPARLVLKQDGTTLTGTAGPDTGEQREIRNGKAENGVLTFEIDHGNFVMRFQLKQDGDEINGDISREREGRRQTAKLSVKRDK